MVTALVPETSLLSANGRKPRVMSSRFSVAGAFCRYEPKIRSPIGILRIHALCDEIPARRRNRGFSYTIGQMPSVTPIET